MYHMIIVQLFWYGFVAVVDIPIVHSLQQFPIKQQYPSSYSQYGASTVRQVGVRVMLTRTATESNLILFPQRQQQRWREHLLQSSRKIPMTRLRGTASSQDDINITPSSTIDEELYNLEIEDLKRELTNYLQLRKDVGADDIAKEQVGKVIGGMKGNKILEFVSVSPNKPSITMDQPNALDYDELTKYGYGHLVIRIMEIGGRNKMYEVMNMDIPAIKPKVIKTAPKIVIDRDGKTKGYQGLKLNQMIDDTIQGQALQSVQRKIELGQRLTASNEEFMNEIESYVQPFADKRNVGPKQTPDYTVEQLDAWGKQQGRVESWARNAKLGAYVNDPMESFDTISVSQRVYSIITSLITAFAFGRATSQLFDWINRSSSSSDHPSVILSHDVLAILQIPSALLLLLSLASGIYCGSQAPTKNRSIFVWTMKGLLGGPFTTEEFISLSTRQTQQEVLDGQKQK